MVLPSGELHIKDVRPEDGLKEYRSAHCLKLQFFELELLWMDVFQVSDKASSYGRNSIICYRWKASRYRYVLILINFSIMWETQIWNKASQSVLVFHLKILLTLYKLTV